MFIYRLLVSSLWNGGVICIMLFLKRLLHDRVSLRFHYWGWYVLAVSLVLPFLPNSFWREWRFFSSSKDVLLSAYGLPADEMITYQGTQWLQDSVQLAAEHAVDFQACSLMTCLWLAGMFAVMGYYFCGTYRLYHIKKYAVCPSSAVLAVFHSCCEKYSICRPVQLRQFRKVSAPISFGWRKPMIVLPDHRMDTLTESELEHILLHELSHIRHGDFFTNYLFCILQAMYWFHPLVWVALGNMRQDREAYCDWSVLNLLHDEPARTAYGITLLHFSVSEQVFYPAANGLAQNVKQLKYRLEQIADYRRDTTNRIMLGRCMAGILTAGCMLQIPFIALCAETSGEYYVPQVPLSVITGDMGELSAAKYGCAVVYSLSQDNYIVFNEAEITRRVPPCSTVKIYSALNALEQGVITPADSTMPWDGTEYAFPAWESSQCLSSAMHQSVNWYFQSLDEIVGVGALSGFYKGISYGNAYIGDDAATYWNGSALKISALEQVQLLVKLYRNDFGFREENIAAVTDALYLGSSQDCRLYGKTGTGMVGSANIAGWFVGYAETGTDVLFFAVYLCEESGADGAAAVSVTKDILNEMGIAVPQI